MYECFRCFLFTPTAANLLHLVWKDVILELLLREKQPSQQTFAFYQWPLQRILNNFSNYTVWERYVNISCVYLISQGGQLRKRKPWNVRDLNWKVFLIYQFFALTFPAAITSIISISFSYSDSSYGAGKLRQNPAKDTTSNHFIQ